ncbi:hypothetical protein L0U88_03920 [Flavihumibacter sp. RY-1]|uniref:Lipoprotein n=1 Tax=Flavihumibacter fluminis TaxID=2909236 RepID=A0ABS9BDI6_9BACT|nr:hypothetical protein [Flavihumibacter fluminis]MCF1713774.1 hypothetical protein [Flavihumibacter fluminis]
MNRYLFCTVCFALFFSSCGIRGIEGRERPVYFTADDIVFTDSLDKKPHMLFHGKYWIDYPCMNTVYLQKGIEAKAYISGPTIFRMDQVPFLVYPGDRIQVVTNPDKNWEATFFSKRKDKRRNAELQVLKRFEQLEKSPELVRLLEYSYQDILDLETRLKTEIIPARIASLQLLDSLSAAYKVGRKFKRATKNYLTDAYNYKVLSLYWLYRDTLLKREVFFSKVRAFLPAINNLNKKVRLDANSGGFIGSVNTAMYPSMGVSSMVRQNLFETCFDTLANTFRGPARDLLLTRLMYHAILFEYEVPEDYVSRYKAYSLNPAYRKILKRARKLYGSDEGENQSASSVVSY